MAHILAIGIATLDIINILDGYPAEDAEVRACRVAGLKVGQEGLRDLPLAALCELEPGHG